MKETTRDSHRRGDRARAGDRNRGPSMVRFHCEMKLLKNSSGNLQL